MNRLDYEKEVIRQLADITTYKQLEYVPNTSLIIDKLYNILAVHNKLFIHTNSSNNNNNNNSLNNNNKNKTALAKYVLQQEKKKLSLAKFYINMKIHKTPTLGRPICSSIGTITYHASNLLDKWLQPLAKNTMFYIKDSNNFIINLETYTFPHDCLILTADVESLYPSIVIHDGLVQLKRALTLAKIPSQFSNLLVDMCQWVLENNFIEFGNTTWHQIKGTSMGTPVSVCFAIIYLAMLELDVIEICKQDSSFKYPILIKRFIDDIISIFYDKYSALLFITKYNLIRPNTIKLTHQLSEHSGIFLDIEIFKGERMLEGKMDYKIHQKPMNQYLYIPPFSYHNKTMFKAFIQSEINRYKVKCSDKNDYYNVKSLFFNRLIARGYEIEKIIPLFETSDYDDRSNILQHLKSNQNKSNNNCNNSPSDFSPLVLSVPLSKRTTALNLPSIFKNQHDASFNPNYNSIFGYPPRVIVSYKRSKNLGDMIGSSRYKYSVTTVDNNNL